MSSNPLLRAVPTPAVQPLAGPRQGIGQLLVAGLKANGVDRVFCVPGESYLPALDGLYRSGVDVVVCHHESAAGFMALADTRMTGRPSAAFVSRGPGATNASIAVHTAQQDGVPFLLFVGQVPRKSLRRGAFQEIDYGIMFGGIAKWVAEVRDPESFAEVLARAFHIACTPTPGPVIIVLPEDLLEETAAAVEFRPVSLPVTAPSETAIAQAVELLHGARRPLVIAGGELATETGRAALARLAETWNLPVVAAFRRHDVFDNTDPHFAGELGVQNTAEQMTALREADLILALGTRLNDLTTHGYTFPESPFPKAKLVHVYDDPAVIGTNFRADVGAACRAETFIGGLSAAAPARSNAEWGPWVERLHALRAAITVWKPRRAPDGVVFGNVVAAVVSRLDRDGIVVLDAGYSAAMFYKHFPVKPPQRLLASIAGVMGFGMPGSVAVALRMPGRQIVCIVGDGDFMMTGNELALAVERKLPIRIILAHNRSYGSIRVQQEREFPGRNIGTDLSTPDFALLARAFGCASLVVDKEEQVGEMLDRAFATAGPVLVEVKTSLSAILPSA